jgi:Zn-dependent peptidase ImmA (M78 family)
MADDTAPLVFINGKDTKAAQMFTLAHELAHIWLGESGLSDIQANADPHLDIERWCNQVAAEVLVPLARMKEVFNPDLELDKEIQSLARRFKVSGITCVSIPDLKHPAVTSPEKAILTLSMFQYPISNIPL